jgi:hypothetical protein
MKKQVITDSSCEESKCLPSECSQLNIMEDYRANLYSLNFASGILTVYAIVFDNIFLLPAWRLALIALLFSSVVTLTHGVDNE